MSTRQDVADAFRPIMPESVTIVPHPDYVDNPGPITSAVVVIERREVTPTSTFRQLSNLMSVWLVDPQHKTDLAAAEDNLDLNLDLILEALITHDKVHFEKAERDSYLDKFHAWRIDVRLTSTIEKEGD